MTSFAEVVVVDDREMDLYLALPEDSAPFAAIVVIQHAGGVDTFTRTMTDRLASAGYAAVAPDLYHRLGNSATSLDSMAKLRQLRDVEMIADVDATVAFLKRHDAVDASAFGITGFCMGGRVVYLMAAALSAFRAAVAFYGGNIMVPWGAGVEAPFSQTNQISCPLMFHFGENDTNPSPDDMGELDAELTCYGKEHQFYSYPNAGHGFMDFTREDRFHEAAELAWARTMDFFDTHLKSA